MGPVLSKEEMLEQSKANDGIVKGKVVVDLYEVIDNDIESFLDLISERLTGDTLLMDVHFEILSGEKNSLILMVSGHTGEMNLDEE